MISKENREKYNKYFSQPEITFDAHVENKKVELEAEIRGKYKIYLDLKFWIKFRDVELGRSEDECITQLLNRIKHLVDENISVCPISEPIFLELMKQSDPTTRNATAKLIDELSLGITSIGFQERVKLEFRNYYYTKAGVTGISPLKPLVWTRAALVLGVPLLSISSIEDSQELLIIKKMFFDDLWKTPLIDVIKNIGFEDQNPEDWQKEADKINLDYEENSAEINSFKQSFKHEFIGGLSLFKEYIEKLFRRIYLAGYEDIMTYNDELSANEKFEDFTRSIYSLHIQANCFAVVRWDKKRKLTGNDLLDFQHAGTALQTCNLFLTEKPLKSLLQQKNLGFSELYLCKIASSAQEALDILEEEIEEYV